MKYAITDTDEREQYFIRLYKTTFPAIARYVSKRGGSLEEAKDVFQDAVIIYYEKSVSTRQFPDNESAYLMGIAKHLWLKIHRNNSAYVSLDDNDAIMDAHLEHNRQLLNEKLLDYLETSGQKCMELLRSFYYDTLPLANIAAKFGFSGIRSATVQKFKCLEKVRNTLKSKSLSYEDFVE